MKPMSPEDRELEELSANASARYRAGAKDEPSRKVDEAILAAARQEVERPQRRRAWQVPASIAAVFVLAISLGLLVHDHEPPLPTLGAPSISSEPVAKLAKSAPSQPALKAQAKGKADAYREERPSRERTVRPDRESPVVRDEAAASRDSAATLSEAPSTSPALVPEAASPPPAPAAAVAPPPAAAAITGNVAREAREPEKVAEPAVEALERKKAGASADSAPKLRAQAQTLRKEETAAAAQDPREWLRKIDDLVKAGRTADAKEQMAAFRKQYPAYPIPEDLRPLSP